MLSIRIDLLILHPFDRTFRGPPPPLPAFFSLSSSPLPSFDVTQPFNTLQPHSHLDPCPRRLFLKLPSIQESALFAAERPQLAVRRAPLKDWIGCSSAQGNTKSS